MNIDYTMKSAFNQLGLTLLTDTMFSFSSTNKAYCLFHFWSIYQEQLIWFIALTANNRVQGACHWNPNKMETKTVQKNKSFDVSFDSQIVNVLDGS